jgi:uncharacterized protein (TIGR02679 family)
MSRTVDQDLKDPGLARLFTAARARFEARGGPTGNIRLPALEPEEAKAIDAWWRHSARKRPRRNTDFVCSLRQLDASLTELIGLSLEEALTRLGGPLRLRPQERDQRQRLAAAFWEEALDHPLCQQESAVREWVERIRSTGRLGVSPTKSGRGAALLASLNVGAALPCWPPLERSTFATEMLGAPHALDDETTAGKLLVSQLTTRDGCSGLKLTAGERRALLQRFGVLCDPASATVLTLGLRPIGESALEQALRLLVGGHVVLTLGQLSATALRFEPGLTVRLCENPAVVLRAESRLGRSASPLVCTGGWPGSAACALLDALRGTGARFVHHGDFDWDGLAIWRWLRDRYGAEPWRFDPQSYRASVSSTARFSALAPPRQTPDPEDPLTAALFAGGVAVPEEALLDDLIADLGEPS